MKFSFFGIETLGFRHDSSTGEGFSVSLRRTPELTQLADFSQVVLYRVANK
jgi:hypothetical protein